MVCQGWDDTLRVSVDDITYHCRSVVRGSARSVVMADVPFLSATSVAQAIETAGALIAKGGANVIKLEQSPLQAALIDALGEQGIAVCSHLGLRPQHILKSGRYRYAGTTEDLAEELYQQADAVEAAGASMILLECVPRSVAATISKNAKIPVIGIGSGDACDGQILVSYDIIGISRHIPRFAKNFLSDGGSIKGAFEEYAQAVRSGQFPGAEHTKY